MTLAINTYANNYILNISVDCCKNYLLTISAITNTTINIDITTTITTNATTTTKLGSFP